MIFPACYFTLLEHSPMSQNDKKFPKAQDSFEFWIIDGKDHLKGKKKCMNLALTSKAITSPEQNYFSLLAMIYPVP